MTNSATAKTPRRRGRPRQDEASGDDLREAIIKATAVIYAEKGFHGTSVALILKAANVSRPTFYKLFNDRRDVIEVLVQRANERLLARVVDAIGELNTPAMMMKAAIGAYFDWCSEIGPLVGPIYAEINDAASPASEHRGRIIGDLVSLITLQEQRLGLPSADPLFYDALLRAVEHLGSSAFWPERLNEEEIVRRRSVAIEMALTLIQGDRS